MGSLALSGRADGQPATGTPVGDAKPKTGDGAIAPKRPPIDTKNVPDKGPRLDSDLVFQFIYFAHSNIDVVRDMLAEQPNLVTAAWDWGGGDWETALGAASHMGRRDIAELLLSKNARIDLFAATMLGKLDVVKATLTALPEAISIPGPHGIPLIAHAQKGGEQAKEVLDFLRALAAKTR
jgi:hypothetical protein